MAAMRSDELFIVVLEDREERQQRAEFWKPPPESMINIA